MKILKKLFLLICLSLTTASAVHAQFKVNAELGTSYTNVKLQGIDNLPTHKPVFGFYASVTPEYAITKNLILKVELQESIERYEYNSFFTEGSFFNFLRVIPELEFRLKDKIGIFGGLNMGYKAIDVEIMNTVPIPNPGLNAEPLGKTDIGVLAGMTYYFGDFYVTAKYNFGIILIDRVFVADSTGTLFIGQEVRSSFLQVGLGYAFDFSNFFKS